MTLANAFGSDKSLQLAESNTKHVNSKTHFITMAIQQVLISFKLLKINRLSNAGAENNTQMKKKSNLCKKLKFSIYIYIKPPPNIAQVQISDKNLHPFVYSVFYSRWRGRERERENSTKSGAWVCWSWSMGVLELERGCAARGKVKWKRRESLWMQRWRERQVINMRKSDVKEKRESAAEKEKRKTRIKKW
jgi:hypothetical protein